MRAGELRPLARTEVEISVLTLGGTPFGDMYEVVPDEQAVATIERAYEVGVRSFDTAPLYGVGKSERRLGLGIRNLPRDELTLCSKVGRVLQDDDGTIPPTFEYGEPSVLGSLAGSRTRIGVERIDVVHVHDPDRHIDAALEGAFPTLRRLQADGVIGAVSAGMNHTAPLCRFIEEGAVDCVLLNGRTSLLDHSAIDDLLPLALERGVSVIAGGVFNSGVLADPDADPRFVNFRYQPASPEVLEQVARIRAVCERHGVGLRAAALQYPLLHPAVAAVVVGCRSPAEVVANAADLEVVIPAEVWNELGDEGLVRPMQP
jgi:D-threo-aldose 1-dehydrogenase